MRESILGIKKAIEEGSKEELISAFFPFLEEVVASQEESLRLAKAQEEQRESWHEEFMKEGTAAVDAVKSQRAALQRERKHKRIAIGAFVGYMAGHLIYVGLLT